MLIYFYYSAGYCYAPWHCITYISYVIYCISYVISYVISCMSYDMPYVVYHVIYCISCIMHPIPFIVYCIPYIVYHISYIMYIIYRILYTVHRISWYLNNSSKLFPIKSEHINLFFFRKTTLNKIGRLSLRVKKTFFYLVAFR